MKTMLVVRSPFNIVVGSHVHNLGGTGVRTLQVGEVFEAKDTISMSSNVWITTSDGVRGKIECGNWRNLVPDRAQPV